MATVAYPGTPGTTIYGGVPIPTAGTQITTITLANTSATEQGAGFVSPMFGLPLKQGDVPSGQYPAFYLADDTPVPATVHSVTTWPDGSMKWCGVLLRVPSTVAGSGSLAITVKNGGSAPASSARALSDFTAADLSVELTGVTSLSGVWTATLNDAITNGTAVQIGDGPAGAIWRVLGDFKQSGTAHGQLVCWHYVAALQNASGGLQGIRYLGRVAQPWADVNTPPATSRVMASRLVSGSTTVRSLQGYTEAYGTLGSNIRLPHYGSFFTSSVDGRWDYFQSGGSAAADCTVRVVHDSAYVVASEMAPPVDLSLSPAAGTDVDYYPSGNAGMSLDMSAGGGREDIGVWPSWANRHLLLKTASTEKRLRAAGLSSGGWRFCVRKSTTREPVPVANTRATFDGLGAPETTWKKVWGDTNIVGFVAPVSNTCVWNEDTAHRPSPAYPAYILTGEPQYYDLVIENAFSQPQNCYTGSDVERTTRPLTKTTGYTSSGYQGERTVQINGTNYPGAGVMFWDAGLRIVAWGIRDIAQGAAIAQAPHKQYLDDLVQNSFDASVAYVNAQPTSYKDAGFYWRRQGDGSHEAPWMYNHMCMAVAFSADVTKHSSAAAFRTYLAKSHEAWVNAGSSPNLLTAFRYAQFKEQDLCDTLQDCVFEITDGVLAFTASTGRVQASAPSWTPTAGDVVAFSSSGISSALPPITDAASDKRYYVVNPSGATFQLSETLGGAALPFTGDATITGYFVNAKTVPASANISFVEYVTLLSGAVRWFNAAGDTVPNALTASNSLITSRGADLLADLAFAMQSER